MKTKRVLLSLAIALSTASFAVYCVADDTSGRRKHHEESKGHGDKYNGKHDKLGSTPAATNGAYTIACGSCHWAFAPQLLPQKSWKNTLTSLGDHFGSEVVLSEQQKKAVSDHLLSNAADVSSSELGRKVMHSLGGATPSRVVEVPYIQRKHRKLAPKVFARKAVGTLANCIACHPGAANLDFEDDRIRIPAQ